MLTFCISHANTNRIYVRTCVKKSVCPTLSGVVTGVPYSEVRTAKSRERVCERPGCVRVSSYGQWKVTLLWMLSSCVRLSCSVRQCRWKQVNCHRSEPPEGIDARPSTRFCAKGLESAYTTIEAVAHSALPIPKFRRFLVSSIFLQQSWFA